MKNLYLWARLGLAAAALALVSYAGWSVRNAFHARDDALAQRDATIGQLHDQVQQQQTMIEEQRRQIARLQMALKLLKHDHRVARLEVLEQRPNPGRADQMLTTVRFVEVSPDGAPLGTDHTYTLLGRVAYVDALVIKFEDEYVEQGAELRGTSVCLFRRIFGEFQKPQDGFAIDSHGVRPHVYRDPGAVPDFERELWSQFWEYANDPQKAQQAGVRAMHGEAPYIELRPGMTYRLQLRASDGLSIVPETMKEPRNSQNES